VTNAEAGSELADARHRARHDQPSERSLAARGIPSRGADGKRPINHVYSLDDIAKEHIAMEANTAAYDLVVTL
jgi:hypothetical protein